MEHHILKFIDDFYYDMFTEVNFNAYKEGHLTKKKNGFTSLDTEVEMLLSCFTLFSLDKDQPILWNIRQMEIEFLEAVNGLTFKKARDFFCRLFSPSDRLVRRNSKKEDFTFYKNVKAEELTEQGNPIDRLEFAMFSQFVNNEVISDLSAFRGVQRQSTINKLRSWKNEN